MTRFGPWLFGVAVFVLHAISPLHVQTDSQWNVPVALSLLHHGDTTLDEYRDARALTQHGVEEHDGHWYNAFPLGPSLVALPLVALADLVPNQRWQSHSHAEAALKISFFDTTEVLVGSLCVAVSAALMVLIIRARAAHRLTPWLGAFVLAFASPAWSTASRGLWQHGPAMLFLTLALWVWLGARPFALGLCLAAAFTCRPTTAIPIAVICLAMAKSPSERRHLAWVGLGATVVAAPWLVVNHSMWGQWLPPYYLPSRLEGNGAVFAEALLGNLVSAGRGLLIFCPIIALISKGVRRDVLSAVAISVLVLHWLAISRFPHWWAGHSFGPRLFTELTPFWVLLLVPWLDTLFVQRRWWRVPGLVTAALIACTAAIHARGALSKRPWSWNTTPVNIDDAPERLWDFRDLQFLR